MIIILLIFINALPIFIDCLFWKCNIYFYIYYEIVIKSNLFHHLYLDIVGRIIGVANNAMGHRFTISYLIRLIERSGLHRWGRWEHIAYYTEKTARVSLRIDCI